MPIGRPPKGEIETLQASLPVVVLSGTDYGVWIDLDGTVDQLLMVPHGLSAAPAKRKVFIEPIASVALDLSEVRLEYVKYLEASSTGTAMAFAVKLLTGSGTPGQQGELRVVLHVGCLNETSEKPPGGQAMPRTFLTFDGDMEGDRIIAVGAGVEPTDAVNKVQPMQNENH